MNIKQNPSGGSRGVPCSIIFRFSNASYALYRALQRTQPAAFMNTNNSEIILTLFIVM
jgi:hypothetical protein